MFDPKELETIMKNYDIDMESAYYYLKYDILPDPILIERLTHYIEEYVENINCRSPRGFSFPLIDYIQLCIDQYPNKVDPDGLNVPSCVYDVLEKVLTPERLAQYQKNRPVDKMEGLMFRREYHKRIEQEVLKGNNTFHGLLRLVDSLIIRGNPNSVIAAYESLTDVFNETSIELTKENIYELKDSLKKYEKDLKETDYTHLEIRIRLLESSITNQEFKTILEERYQRYNETVNQSSFKDTIDGVTFSSKSMRGLRNLMSFYRTFQIESNTIYNQFFLKILSDKKLILTDIAPPNSLLEPCDGPCFVSNTNIIYLDEDCIKGYYSTEILYHEGEHFVNATMDDEVIKRISNILESIRFSINKNDTSPDFLRDYEDEYYHWYQFFDSFKEDGIDALRDEILKREGFVTDHLLEIEWDRYCKNMTYGHLFQNGYNAIADIFDAIFKGKFSNAHVLLGSGHGMQFQNEKSCCEEVMSEIALLYNNGNIDLLLQYFPHEDIKELIQIYEESVGMNSKREEFLQDKESIMQRVNTSLDDSSFSQFTYEIAAYYLEQAMKKIGEKEFIDLLIEYQMTGNLDLFPDEEIKKYISLLDDGHISMFLQGNLTTELSRVYDTLNAIMKEYEIEEFYHLLMNYLNTLDMSSIQDERIKECLSLLSIGQVNYYIQNYVMKDYLENRIRK